MNACPNCQRALEGVLAHATYCPTCGHNLVGAPQPQADWVRGGVDLRGVAEKQRKLIAVIGVQLLCYFATWGLAQAIPALALVVGLTYLVLIVLSVVFAVQLLGALGSGLGVRILVVILMFAPCINLITLLVVNNQATTALRMAGVKVGFFGARDDEVLQRLSRNACRQCGYNLIGNTTGICPECGTRFGAT